MSERISVTLINKGFYQKYGVKVVNPLKQGLKQNNFMIYYVFIFVKVVNPLK